MNLANWQTQLRKGLLELCALNYLAQRDYYGYDLVQELKRSDGLQIREGTIYPILARLEEDGYIASAVEPSTQGPPRKVFHITPNGKRAIREMNQHWERLAASVAASTQTGKETNR